MKGTKRILAILAAVLLMAVVVVTAFATAEEGYTGSLEKVDQLISIVDAKSNVTEKVKAMDNVTAELDKVDPATEGYTEAVAAVDAKELEIALIFIADDANLATAKEREQNLASLMAFLEKHSFTDLTEGEENFDVRLAALKLAISTAYLEESVASADADGKKTALDALTAYLTAYKIEIGEQFAADIQSESYATAKLYIALVEKTMDPVTGMFNTACASFFNNSMIEFFIGRNYFSCSINSS